MAFTYNAPARPGLQSRYLYGLISPCPGVARLFSLPGIGEQDSPTSRATLQMEASRVVNGYILSITTLRITRLQPCLSLDIDLDTSSSGGALLDSLALVQVSTPPMISSFPAPVAGDRRPNLPLFGKKPGPVPTISSFPAPAVAGERRFTTPQFAHSRVYQSYSPPSQPPVADDRRSRHFTVMISSFPSHQAQVTEDPSTSWSQSPPVQPHP